MSARISPCAAGGACARGRKGAVLCAMAALAGAFAMAGGLSGCASPAAVAAEHREATGLPVRLTIVNLSPRAWRLEVQTGAGQRVRSINVPGGASFRVELPGGDYVIEQTMLTAGGARETSRRLPVSLAAGGDYEWPLATLLAEAVTIAGETPRVP